MSRETGRLNRMWKAGGLWIAAAGLALGGLACGGHGSHGAAEPGAGEKGKILYYRNPMDPKITSPTPKKDEMGMDYVPVYENEVEKP